VWWPSVQIFSRSMSFTLLRMVSASGLQLFAIFLQPILLFRHSFPRCLCGWWCNESTLVSCACHALSSIALWLMYCSVVLLVVQRSTRVSCSCHALSSIALWLMYCSVVLLIFLQVVQVVGRDFEFLQVCFCPKFKIINF
jgi:hypothetical protein